MYAWKAAKLRMGGCESTWQCSVRGTRCEWHCAGSLPHIARMPASTPGAVLQGYSCQCCRRLALITERQRKAVDRLPRSDGIILASVSQIIFQRFSDCGGRG